MLAQWNRNRFQVRIEDIPREGAGKNLKYEKEPRGKIFCVRGKRSGVFE
jgi:hypothetical protein